MPFTATVTAPRALSILVVLALFGTAAGLGCAALRRGTGGPGASTTAPAPPPRLAGATPAGEAALGGLTVRAWRLDNGLEVITVPDAAARAISVVTAFRVGSRDEDPAAGELGLAHFFEHLMFRGAPAPGQADFDQQMEEVGGNANAETSADATTYVDDGPPEALERLLRLEAGRLRGLELTDPRVANERKVVVEERLATVEDSVDGTMEELAWRQAFPAHPYGRSIIGGVDDIKAITRERAQSFYQRHYGPGRAVLVVAGRFDEGAALTTIVAAHGTVPAGNAEAAPPVGSPEQAPRTEVRTMIERPVPADRLLVAFPAPALASDDRAAFEVLAEALVGGPASRLARQLVVERSVASSIAGELAATREPGLWLIWVAMHRGQPARAAEDAVLAELDRATAQGISEAELTAAARRLESAYWGDLTHSQGRARALAQFHAVTGDFRRLLGRGDAYARVTTDEVRRVARAYFGSGARSVVVASAGAGGRP